MRQLASTAIAKLIDSADHAPALLAAPASDFALRAGLPSPHDGASPALARSPSSEASLRFVWWRLEHLLRHLGRVSEL